MLAKWKAVVLIVLLKACLCGCAPKGLCKCEPKEMFSCIDRHCFVADWTNHYSCISCCRNGACGQAYPAVEYPMLVLGEQSGVDAATETPVPVDEPVGGIGDAAESNSNDR
jgi:hypothetical protein